ncbi:Nn.00g036330.m01.CDS01 [Neocucurbitaria sp. VM-36]
MSLSWGFTIDDKVRLAREWGAAAVSCLNMGNFTSQYHICSVQAIYIMHAYEHLVGSTNQWIALRSVAVVIAKSLGLHKLGPHPDDDRIHELNPEQKQAFVDREIGRRTWYTLTSQEWLCSTAQSGHCIGIQMRHFTTTRPKNLEEETMTPVDEATPTFTLVGTYFFDYAALLLEFHNSMLDAEDEEEQTKYARVLKFDGEMRVTCVEKIPRCLSPRTPPDPNWPKWVGWARRLHQASVNHKIIMIHQAYLSKSFKNVRYTFSRWACATAAKNIINMYNTREPEEPQWWVEQAFVVTAGTCLVLDLFNRTENDPEAQEYQACVQKAICYLQQCFTSSVAVHGVRLLLSLLQEYNKILEGLRSNTNQVVGSVRQCPGVLAQIGDVDIPDNARASNAQMLPSDPEVPLSIDEAAQFNFDIDALGFEDLMDYLPSEGGLDNNVLFDSIYNLNSGQFSY